MDISSVFSNQSSVDLLIAQMMQQESRGRDLLVSRQKDLNDRKTVLSNLNSKLSALRTKSTRLTDTFTDYFATKKVVTSDATKLTASAGANADGGSHTITVERLSSADTRISQQYDNSTSSFAGLTGDQTFTIEVAHPTDDDPDNRVQISVTVAASAFQGTDDDVLDAISDSINSAMSQAVTDETIDNDEVVHASVVHEQSGTSRLVVKADQSGYANRIEFGASALLDTLQVNADALYSGTAGGYMTNVGTSASDSELNAKFVMDGLTFYRDSNSVSDAVGGLTIQLLNTFDSPETLTVNTDTEAVQKEVQGFLDAYNDAVKLLKQETQIDPGTLESGSLTGDRVFRDLVYQLRGIMTGEVNGTLSQNYTKLYNIGIEADRSGILSIKDKSKFTEALETNPQYVSDLFKSEDGIAGKVDDLISNFVKAGGKISKSKQNITSEVTSLGDRIKYMNELLDKKETQLRDEFNQLQDMMVRLANQQSFFSMFTTQY